MGFNEPEISGQSNMAVSQAVQLWNQFILPLKDKGTLIISPATTSDPNGKKWMLDFFNQCGGPHPHCGVDVVAAHWYDIHADDLIAYLKDLHASYFNLPLMLTEFDCQNFNNPNLQCTFSEIWAFQAKVTAFFEQTSWILIYAPFGISETLDGVNIDNRLLGSNGQPNSLAHSYFPNL